ncbi:MAG: helicase-related protein, partial [Pirellulaceae bacterium]
QVQSDVRQEREKEFRSAELPILFCSPTMELGVDIAQLNVVNMRNVPPTPANYAQRSGRAGRGGQPALVYTYCSGFSPHDKYYFRHPERMVAGAVTAPRLDLLNRDLVEAHVHAIWLSEAKLNLGSTLTEILVVTEEDLALPLNERTQEVLADASAKLRAQQRAKRLLQSIGPELQEAPWYRDDWLDDVLTRLPQRFDEACNRWRSLYRAAVQQRQHQNQVIGDHSRQQIDRDRAKRLRAQAETQISLLTNPQNAFEGDFYSYRYFASEGFLPGYNFPRLPLSAFIPARRGRRGKDEFLSRPRFLAISEYGPRAVIYHEGSRYRINKVNLAFDEDSRELTQYIMKLCSACGYGHFVESGPGADNCENCGRALEPTDEIREMVRLQNVTAKRADRITSDEEERQRVGYEIRSTFRFSTVNGVPDFRKAEVKVGDRRVATMRYGDAATIWRINVGWRKRRRASEHGFLLDVERGYWATNRDVEEGDREDPLSQARIKRVVPYVQDSRNALTFELEGARDVQVMATLQAALKQGIQQVYQLEPNELAVDPLPSVDDRRILFFYEASEGGAGVLRQVAEEPNAIAEVVKAALVICHFHPDTGEDEGGGYCEAACYDCLLEYSNQPDHRTIDRQVVVNLLMDLSKAVTEISGSRRARVDHLDELMRACDSGLERRWLKQVHESQLRLPNDGQYLISACSTRPDFYYKGVNTAVYIDGPIHDEPDQKAEDEEITQRLIGAGYLVIRFHHAADWNAIFDQYADVFGQRKGV